MSATIETLRALDKRLASKGVPPLTAWWDATLEHFYTHPTARTLVARVGRSGAKSHTSCKVALNETLFGSWVIPPGEIHRYIFVSVDKTEAGQRLHTLREFLTVLSVPFNAAGDEIVLTEMPRAFKVCAAQVSGVSGYRAFGASLDEAAKWASGDAYADPADEIATSVGAMLVNHPGARRLIVSSPFGLDDYHARLFDAGDTGAQVTCHAPTWIANPSITEARTHEIESDPAKHAREYAAIPSNTVNAAFELEDVDAAFETVPSGAPSQGWIAVDPSSLLGDDSYAYARGWISTASEVVVAEVGSYQPSDMVSTADATARIAQLARTHGIRLVFADHYESGGNTAAFTAEGLEYKYYNWSETTKDQAFGRLRSLMRDRRLVLPTAAARLRRELGAVKARLQLNGRISYATNGLDHLSCLVTLAHAIGAGDITPEENSLLRMARAMGSLPKAPADVVEQNRLAAMSRAGLELRHRLMRGRGAPNPFAPQAGPAPMPAHLAAFSGVRS